jgi:GMP synthase PP-ATPase subunit
MGLRAVTSTDGMTADFFPFNMTFLGAAAIRKVGSVNHRPQQRRSVRSSSGST